MFDLSTATSNTAETMSSLAFLNKIINPARERAGEAPVRNVHFISRIEDEIDDLGVMQKFCTTTSQGAIREVMGYDLTLEQMTLIGMRESKAVRRSVLETLKKLQKPKQELNLNDPKQLLGLLQNYAEENLRLQEKVEEAAPKVEFVDSYVEATGLLGFREVCKLLGIKEYTVRDWLVAKGIIYKLGGKWAFSASWLDAKNGEHKTSYDVYGRAVISIKFTPKGFAYIAQRISK